jgi:hypothetical protein
LAKRIAALVCEELQTADDKQTRVATLASAAHVAEDWERFRDEVPHTCHSVSLGREEG